jgi:peptidoglycan/LPS O-acetylase OafA/YrhL
MKKYASWLNREKWDDIGQLGFQTQIEGLRGIAILFILLCHYIGNSFTILWIGVDLFFVLSGFLITRILLSKVGSTRYFRNFYLRRTLRIFPLYYFALALVFFLLPLFPDHFDVTYLVSKQAWFWLYTENWLFAFEGWPKGQNVIISHFWSLAIEEQYYLMWPLVIYTFRNRHDILLISMFLLIGIAICLRLSGELANPGYYTITFARMDSLLIGSLVALGANRKPEMLKRWSLWLLTVSGIWIIMGAAKSSDLSYANPFFSAFGYTILSLFFACVVILSFRRETVFRKMLDSTLLKILGRYSYGLYVFHFPLYWLFRPQVLAAMQIIPQPFIAKSTTALLLLLLTFILTAFSYHFLELPFLRLKKLFE